MSNKKKKKSLSKMLVNMRTTRNYLLFLLALIEVVEDVSAYDKNCPALKLVNGRSRYRFRGRNVRFNCMRGFQLVGAKYASCMNGKWDANVPICVKYGCRAPSTTHVNGQFIESYRGAVVKIICNPGYVLTGSPSVYCNGVKWNETFPVCKVFNTAPALSCDFESDSLCGWSQDPMHDFDWRRKNILSSSADVTGPIFDHTYGANGTGHYMYMGSFKSRMENDTARLYSPVYPLDYSHGRCFKFWYYMHGVNAGTLKVYVKPEGIELFDLIPSFWMNGEQGQSWRLGFFLIEPSSYPFQIVIEGIRGSGYVSETAFDDVEMASGDDCVILESMTSTEYSTLMTSSDDQDESQFSSCENRCDSVSMAAGFTGDIPINEKCSCRESCIRAQSCCLDFSYFCQSTVSESTTTEFYDNSSTTMKSSVSASASPSVKIGAETPTSQMSINNFNNESNEINPMNPVIVIQSTKLINRNATEISSMRTTTQIPLPQEGTATPTNTSKSRLQEVHVFSKPKLPLVPKRTEIKAEIQKNLENKPKIGILPNLNFSKTFGKTDIQFKNKLGAKMLNEDSTNRKLNDVKVINGVSLTSTVLPSKSHDSNAGNLPFLKKIFPIFNDSHFHKEKSQEFSGKEPPQAIKIDKDEDGRNETTAGIFEVAGIICALLIVIVIGIFWYRRSKSRKSERDSMVEDSDVRFLTSDEVLDFTLARPADDDL